VVGVLTLSLLIALGVGALPASAGGIVLGYLMLFALGLGVALINLVASAFSTAWEKLWPTFLRVQYFTCGVFYHPLDMPEEARAFILLNPLVHVTEWMRQAYYPHYVSPFLDGEFLLRSAIVALLAGSLLFVAAQRRLRTHG
jgi:capsular polysaccharide transport system permease protein